jgi:murein DD-endopeptidase MepM/ murein hydrolase activator NlpD
MKPPFISPVAPETRISADFNARGPHWEPRGPDGKGQHKGLDFACPIGTPVRAIAGGTVREVTISVRSGLFVWIEHRDGWHSSYHHLAESLVKPGQAVIQGDTICRSGNSGSNTTGAHLHVTVRDPAGPAADNRVDPRPFVATPYLDIGPEHYGFESARWAKQAGLASGVGGELPREAPLTMIRFLAILHRFWILIGRR